MTELNCPMDPVRRTLLYENGTCHHSEARLRCSKGPKGKGSRRSAGKGSMGPLLPYKGAIEGSAAMALAALKNKKVNYL